MRLFRRQPDFADSGGDGVLESWLAFAGMRGGGRGNALGKRTRGAVTLAGISYVSFSPTYS